MPEPIVHVLTPAHNRQAITSAFAECVRAQDYPHVRFVLVDDGSTDGTSEAVKAILPQAVILRGDGNLWWSGSLQRGFDYLKGAGLGTDDVVLICNDDLFIEPRFISRGVSHLEARPNTLLLAQHRSDGNGPSTESGYRYDSRRGTFEQALVPADINCLATRGLFARWPTVQAIGGFHPFLLPHYLSDYEWTIRAGRKGMVLITHPDVWIVPMSGTTGHHYAQDKDENIVQVLRMLFSRRSAGNLFAWTSFLMLTADRVMLPLLLCHLWASGGWRLLRAAGRTTATFLSGRVQRT
jgi:GT2 family glycosyltransferase